MKLDTPEQEKGYQALSWWLNRRGLPSIWIRDSDIFFIQKFHDTAEWIMGVVSDRVKVLENDVFDLRSRVEKLERLLDKSNFEPAPEEK